MIERSSRVFVTPAGGPREVTGIWKVFLGDERVISNSTFYILNLLKGIYSYGDPPLPIPNREVKPVSADGTALGWESRSMPNLGRASQHDSLFFYFLIFKFQLLIFNCFTYLSVLNQFM